MRYEALRLLCFLIYSMETNQEKRVYRNFRKDLIANGLKCYSFLFIIEPVRTEVLLVNSIKIKSE